MQRRQFSRSTMAALATSLLPGLGWAQSSSPADFAEQVKKEIDKMQRIARFAKISLG